jgi:hypothetical protein
MRRLPMKDALQRWQISFKIKGFGNIRNPFIFATNALRQEKLNE